MINWTEHEKTLPLSKEVCNKLYGKPKTSAEVADMYNKVGDINLILHESNN